MAYLNNGSNDSSVADSNGGHPTMKAIQLPNRLYDDVNGETIATEEFEGLERIIYSNSTFCQRLKGMKDICICFKPCEKRNVLFFLSTVSMQPCSPISWT